MTVEHLRREPTGWARARLRASLRVGVVLGVFLAVTVLAGSGLSMDGDLGLVSTAMANEPAATGDAKGQAKASLSDMRSKYGFGKNVPGIVPPDGTYDGKDVEQPINFSHNLHVEQNGINCMYCHTYARRSKVSGIPPTSKCMGCHTVIGTDRPEIQKLTAMWEKGESPQWKKVHDLPDFVHFTHQRHLKKFLFDNKELGVERVDEVCGQCHGEIKKQTVAKKSKPLTMGFCVSCHQANNGPGDCAKCHK